MPKSGQLSFFYDPEQSTGGFDPADRGSWCVVFVDENTKTEPRVPPSSSTDHPILPRKSLGIVPARSLPSYERLGGYDAPMDEAEFDKLWAYLDQADEDARPRHQLFGQPYPIQNDDMELECQLASNGVYVGGPEGYADPRRPQLEPGAADWDLLFQLDSDEDAGMMWGDVGMLYFWVRRQDAERADFSNVWMVLQCC
jgi:uncharacterized protein YwqG